MMSESEFSLERLTAFWFDEVKPPLIKALDLTPDDKLDWAPAENMITLGNIFMHISEASAWWIDTVIDRHKFIDRTPGPSLPIPQITAMLDAHWERLEDFFARSPEILEAKYDLRRFKRDREVDGYWIFMHLLEHDIHHRSQINHYLRILGIKPPRI